MDPTDPDSVATASSPASAARPLIFVLSPPMGSCDEVDMYFFSPNADVTEGDYAALLAFAATFGYPLAIYQCPDLAAFVATNPTANVRPFSEVPASIIAKGREIMLS